MNDRKILIADDSMFMRLKLSSTLGKNGFKVVGEAADGLDAIQQYRTLMPDLLIMDITMPIMNGLQALKEIKIEFPKAKIIMCSSMGQKAFIEEAIKYGSVGFIVKPYKEENIIGVVKKALGFVTNR